MIPRLNHDQYIAKYGPLKLCDRVSSCDGALEGTVTLSIGDTIFVQWDDMLTSVRVERDALRKLS